LVPGKKRVEMTKKREAGGGFLQKVFAVPGAGLASCGPSALNGNPYDQ
jgi:hypothetical protein